MPEHPFVLYVDRAWRKDPAVARHIPLMVPWWGNPFTGHLPFMRELFNHYSFDTTLYRVTDDPGERADMVLMPYNHHVLLTRFPEMLEQGIAEARRRKVLLLVDSAIDINYDAPPDSVILRYGGYRFLQKPNEMYLPLYADDLLERYCGGALELRDKSSTPTVSFVGWTHLPLLQEVRAVAKDIPQRMLGIVSARRRSMRKGIFLRRKALKLLEASTAVRAHIVRRKSYSGYLDREEDEIQQVRKEFVDTLLNSDYALDVRGDTNGSMRLFEALSLGRIPVIVDTARPLPLSHTLDYRQFSVLVDIRELSHLPERIAAFHASLSPEVFKGMQVKAREAFKNYFRVDALTKHLVEELRAQVNTFSRK